MSKLNSTEIAKIAGVSRSTVSRVVNGYSNVPERTRARVMKVINENEYYPSLSGQLLAGKRTGTIGFFWITGGNDSKSEKASSKIASDMLCSEYFAHVTESAAELGYLVLTCIVRNLTEQESIDWIKRVFMQDLVCRVSRFNVALRAAAFDMLIPGQTEPSFVVYIHVYKDFKQTGQPKLCGIGLLQFFF